jgi:two-component system CheB/CheR fusion protein
MKKSTISARRSGSVASTVVEGDTAPRLGPGFPIVGIGASAGGLEALEQFMGAVPKDCGVAFVVVQHLDPTRKGLMAELLQRGTSMKVVQVKDRTKVLPDHVYVIPPNKDMSILHGVLHLFEPAEARGLRLPIDFFSDPWRRTDFISGSGWFYQEWVRTGRWD